MEKQTLSVDETAQVLGISRGLCYELVRQGKLPAVRLGERRLVIPKQALAKYLQNGGQAEHEQAI